MASDDEPAKLLLPYLQRADELQKHEPLVAYYCRLYAMERGLKIPQNNRTKTTNALLVSLMKQLEKDKKSLKLGPEDHLHVEGFALNVFAKADKQDRAGRADLNTAKTFYAASIFFEILNQFGEVHPELEQKQRYAVWKAADIRRALKEGRKPQPGPPDEDKDLPLPSSTSTGEYDSEQTNQDSTIRNNSRETSATVTQDSQTQPDSYDDISPQNHRPSISPKPSSNLTHSTSMDVLPSRNHPSDNYQSQNLNISPQSSDITRSHSMDVSSPHNYPTDNYQTQSFHQSPSPINSQHSEYLQSYHHQPQYQPEPQQHFTQQQYPSHQDVPSYSYPNFQSYPSFTESSIPAVSSHYPSYYQNPTNADAAYSNLPPNTTPNYPSSAHYDSTSVGKGNVSQDSSTNAQKYEYDSNYQPPPEKISEAHKAARFAVGALAFDDVATAIEHLKKSLELLTNPSAGN